MGLIAGATEAGAAGMTQGGTAKPASPHDWLKRRQRIYWYDQYALNEQE